MRLQIAKFISRLQIDPEIKKLSLACNNKFSLTNFCQKVNKTEQTAH